MVEWRFNGILWDFMGFDRDMQFVANDGSGFSWRFPIQMIQVTQVPQFPPVTTQPLA